MAGTSTIPEQIVDHLRFGSWQLAYFRKHSELKSFGVFELCNCRWTHWSLQTLLRLNCCS